MAGTNKGFRIFANIIMILLMLCCLLPFILLITASITDEATLTLYGYSFFPRKINFRAYEYLFQAAGKITRAYGVTILVTLVGTTLNVTMTTVSYTHLGELPENFGEAGKENQLEEIRLINEKLDELITEMGKLEQERYEKEKEANAALLQYYQLQVRPHFFLNCLNIVASLLNENDVDTVKTMIYAVSRHFRYVFQDSDSLVTPVSYTHLDVYKRQVSGFHASVKR